MDDPAPGRLVAWMRRVAREGRLRARLGPRLAGALDNAKCDDADRGILIEIMDDVDAGLCNLDQAIQRVNDHLTWRVNLSGLAAGGGISVGAAALFADMLAVGSEAVGPSMAHPEVTAWMDGSVGVGAFAFFAGGLFGARRLSEVARRRSVLRQCARSIAKRTAP